MKVQKLGDFMGAEWVDSEVWNVGGWGSACSQIFVVPSFS